MIIPIAPGQWMHMESGTIIADDGQSSLTIQRPSDVTPRTIPTQMIPTVRAILGHIRPPITPQITQQNADDIGVQLWKATRDNM